MAWLRWSSDWESLLIGLCCVRGLLATYSAHCLTPQQCRSRAARQAMVGTSNSLTHPVYLSSQGHVSAHFDWFQWTLTNGCQAGMLACSNPELGAACQALQAAPYHPMRALLTL